MRLSYKIYNNIENNEFLRKESINLESKSAEQKYIAIFKEIHTISLSTFMSKPLITELFKTHSFDMENAPDYRKRIEEMEDLNAKSYYKAVKSIDFELFSKFARSETNLKLIYEVIMSTDDSLLRNVDNEINFRNNLPPLKNLLELLDESGLNKVPKAAPELVKVKSYDKYRKSNEILKSRDMIFEPTFELVETEEVYDTTPELEPSKMDNDELIKKLLSWFFSDAVNLKENPSLFIMKNFWEQYITTIKLIMNSNAIDMEEVNKICNNDFLVTSEVDIDPLVVDFWDTHVLSTLDNPDLLSCTLEKVNFFDNHLVELSKTFSVDELCLFS